MAVMLTSFLCKASLIRKLYLCLGISTFLLITSMIGTYMPNDWRFDAISSSKLLQEWIPWKMRPNAESRVTESQSLPPAGASYPGWSVTETQSLSPKVTYPDWNASLPHTAFGIYIFLDNVSLERGHNEHQWYSLNHFISSSCRSVDRLCVRILINRKDKQRADIARYFNKSASICEQFRTSTEFLAIEVDDLRKSTRTLTQLMARDYVVESIAYFSVIFIPDTAYRAFTDQLQLLLDKNPDGVGLVVDCAQNSTLPSSLFFSKSHGEIFGWFLPPFLGDVELAVAYTFHLYPANLRTLTVRDDSGNCSAERMKDLKSSGFSQAGLWALELDRKTLRR